MQARFVIAALVLLTALVLGAGVPVATGFYRVPGYKARFTVAGKGQLHLAFPGAPMPLDQRAGTGISTHHDHGGSGVYAGASGVGTLTHDARYTPGGAAGTDT